jgi:hypothetical protein
MFRSSCEAVFSAEESDRKHNTPGKGMIREISLYLSQAMNVAWKTDNRNS